MPGSGRSPGLDLEEAGLHRAAEILEAVREAIEGDDRGLADRLVAAWNTKKRRDKALAQEVSALLGRRIKFPT